MRSHQPIAVRRSTCAIGICPSADGPTFSSRLPPRATMSHSIQMLSSTVGNVDSFSIRLYPKLRPMPRHTSHFRAPEASVVYSGVWKSQCS